MQRRASILGALFLAAASPAPALAQPDAFVQSVRDLVAAGTLSGAARAQATATAAAHMRAALTEWDRRLTALPPSRIETALAYRQRGRLEDAVRELDAAQVRGADASLLRALTLEAAGRLPEAGQAFLAAWTIDAGNPVTAYDVAQRAAGVGAADREHARARLLEAYARIGVTRASAAAPPFLVLDLIPDTWSPAPVLGDETTREVFALLHAGRFDSAVAALESTAPAGRGVRPAADGRDVDTPRAHFERGQRHETENRVADARREYEAALPGVLAGRYAIWVGLGRLAQVDGDPEAAVFALQQAALLAPNDPLVHRELADAYASQGRRDDALAELMAALLIAPHDAQAHAAIGGLYLDAGRPADAVTALTRALEHNPARYQTRYTLARAFDRLGRADDAARERALFEKARLESQAQRRRIMAADLEKEDAVRRARPTPGGAK